jgi:membrane-bound inhibitor of C-type lysozyme
VLNSLSRFPGVVLAASALFAAGFAADAAAMGVSASAPPAMAAATAASATPAALAPSTRGSSLSFGNIKVVSRSIVTYRCADGREMGIAYMNTDNQQSFAVIRIEGRHRVFVDTAAASGVRYVSGRYVWWSKGDEGNLYDTMAGENAAPVAKDCKAITQ